MPRRAAVRVRKETKLWGQGRDPVYTSSETWKITDKMDEILAAEDPEFVESTGELIAILEARYPTLSGYSRVAREYRGRVCVYDFPVVERDASMDKLVEVAKMDGGVRYEGVWSLTADEYLSVGLVRRDIYLRYDPVKAIRCVRSKATRAKSKIRDGVVPCNMLWPALAFLQDGIYQKIREVTKREWQIFWGCRARTDYFRRICNCVKVYNNLHRSAYAFAKTSACTKLLSDCKPYLPGLLRYEAGGVENSFGKCLMRLRRQRYKMRGVKERPLKMAAK